MPHNITEFYAKNIEILMEEKNRAENNIRFIIKIYTSAIAALFAFTGYTWKFIFTADASKGDHFALGAFSFFGLFMILVIGIFGKYGVEGIAHAIRRRLEHSYRIIVETDTFKRVLDNPKLQRFRDEEVSLEINHFFKIPGIYTGTATFVIFGSVFYLYYALGRDFNLAVSFALPISIIATIILPKASIKFHHDLVATRDHLINDAASKGLNISRHSKTLRTEERRAKAPESLRDALRAKTKLYRLVTILAAGIFTVLLWLGIPVHFTNSVGIGIIAGLLLSFLMLIEYIAIKSRTTHRGSNYILMTKNLRGCLSKITLTGIFFALLTIIIIAAAAYYRFYILNTPA